MEKIKYNEIIVQTLSECYERLNHSITESLRFDYAGSCV